MWDYSLSGLFRVSATNVGQRLMWIIAIDEGKSNTFCSLGICNLVCLLSFLEVSLGNTLQRLSPVPVKPKKYMNMCSVAVI